MTPHVSSIGELIALQLREPHAVSVDVVHQAIAILKLPGVDPIRIVEQVRESIPSLFDDFSLADVLVSSWSKLTELRQFRDPSGGRGEVALAEHTVEASYRPTLVVRVNQLEATSIELDLRLQIHLQALLLKVAEGKIRHLESGSFALEVTILWKEHTILRPIHTQPAPLGPCFQLRDGLLIP
jgi:hypothetical protein